MLFKELVLLTKSQSQIHTKKWYETTWTCTCRVHRLLCFSSDWCASLPLSIVPNWRFSSRQVVRTMHVLACRAVCCRTDINHISRTAMKFSTISFFAKTGIIKPWTETATSTEITNMIVTIYFWLLFIIYSKSISIYEKESPMVSSGSNLITTM